MRVYKCDCGCYFEQPVCVRESRGEFWGAPAYETMEYCPACGEECFEEVDVDPIEIDILVTAEEGW